VKEVVGRWGKLTPVDLAKALGEIRGTTPELRAGLDAASLEAYVDKQFQNGEQFIVGGTRKGTAIGHFVVGEKTPSGIVYHDHQAGFDRASFSTDWDSFVVIHDKTN
jgi:hypothetical protein